MIVAFLLLALLGIILIIYRREWMPAVLVGSLPFERIPAFDAANITIRISTILFAFAFLVLLFDWLGKKNKLKIKNYFWLLPVYLLVCILSLFKAESLTGGLKVILFTMYSFAVFLVANQLNLKNKKLVFKVLIGVSGIVALFGIYQFIGDVCGLATSWTGLKEMYTKAVFGFPRIQGTLLEPLYLANFLLIPVALLIADQINEGQLFSKKWQHILLILIGTVFVLTVSRGAYLGMIGVLIFMVVFYLRKLNWKKIILLGVDLVVILTFAYGLINFSGWYSSKKTATPIPSSGQKQVQVFSSHAVDSNDGSTMERLSTYRVALDDWKEAPFLGVGIGNYGITAAEKANFPITQIVNNEPLEILAETGLVGFLVIILFLIFLFYYAIRAWKVGKTNKWLIGALLSALIGIMVQYQFFSTLYIVYIWFLLGLITNLSREELDK